MNEASFLFFYGAGNKGFSCIRIKNTSVQEEKQESKVKRSQLPVNNSTAKTVQRPFLTTLLKPSAG